MGEPGAGKLRRGGCQVRKLVNGRGEDPIKWGSCGLRRQTAQLVPALPLGVVEELLGISGRNTQRLVVLGKPANQRGHISGSRFKILSLSIVCDAGEPLLELPRDRIFHYILPASTRQVTQPSPTLLHIIDRIRVICPARRAQQQFADGHPNRNNPLQRHRETLTRAARGRPSPSGSLRMRLTVGQDVQLVDEAPYECEHGTQLPTDLIDILAVTQRSAWLSLRTTCSGVRLSSTSSRVTPSCPTRLGGKTPTQPRPSGRGHVKASEGSLSNGTAPVGLNRDVGGPVDRVHSN